MYMVEVMLYVIIKADSTNILVTTYREQSIGTLLERKEVYYE